MNETCITDLSEYEPNGEGLRKLKDDCKITFIKIKGMIYIKTINNKVYGGITPEQVMKACEFTNK